MFNQLARCSQTKKKGFFDFLAPTLDSRISTATRATTETYFTGAITSGGVLATAAADTFPRNFDPITGVCIGRGNFSSWSHRPKWNRDFTNAIWVKTNMTTAKTSTGIDGVANSCSRLTATAANATALQALTIASGDKITWCWIKRITGTGSIDLTQDNGTTWTTVTTTSSWTLVQVPYAVLTNPTVGIRIVTNGDAVDVDFFSSISSQSPAPVVEVSGTAITTTRTSMIVATPSSFGHNATEGTLIVEYITPHFSGSASIIVSLNDATANEDVAIRKGNTDKITVAITDGGVAQMATSPTGSVALVAGATNRVVGAYKLNASSVYASDGNSGQDASCTMPTITQMTIGQGGLLSSSLNGFIRSIYYVPKRVSTTEGPLAARL